MSVPEYSAGEWTAVVRPGFVALLGPAAAESTVRALWQDAGEGVFAALALLARDGFGGLPPFAVVSVEGQRVHAALRGDVEVVVEVGGRSDVWRSGEVSTWTERVLDGVSDVVVQVGGADLGGGSLPLVDGIASASRVRVGLSVRDGGDGVAGPAAAAVATAPVAVQTPAPQVTAHEPEMPVADAGEQVDAPQGEKQDETRGATEDEAQGESHDEGPDESHDEGPDASHDEAQGESQREVPAVFRAEPVVLPAWPVQPAASPAAAVDLEAAAHSSATVDSVTWDEPTEVELVPVAADRAGRDDDVDDRDRRDRLEDPTGVVAVAESFLTPPAGTSPVPVGGASLDDHDGLTILSTDLAEIRDQLPSWAADEVPGPFRVPARDSSPARLVLSTGLVVPLDRAVLLGRAPQVARVTNRELPRLITVPSPQQDISRTHAEVRVDGEHVVVTDLDSTNGIHVARAGEGARRLHPGEPSVVGADEVVDLGDGVTFSVERGS
ncbi:FHA domain-containing protein [Cellulomonas fengjieae]|uniref:FHA domain-containing protein n=1 Tax=Cellulomonas fengjieae TaxID=2819978 RepID=UPI001AAED8EC|nr:FHA domain-containing protein [Cellulomonas fengjieae]MBO3101242.1 FHA domain-containing protein [Cellulomonas fengjieae]